MSQSKPYSCLRFQAKEGQAFSIDDIVFQNDIEPYYAAIENAEVGSSVDMILKYSENNLREVAKYFPNPINQTAKIVLMLEGSTGNYDRLASIEVSHLPGYELALKVIKINS